MSGRLLLVVVVCARGTGSPTAAAQTTIQGETPWRAKSCARAGCHTGAPAVQSYAVAATNAAVSSSPVSVTVTWQPAGGSANCTGPYWNSLGGSENGWGINLTHQGDVIFGTWFTYDVDRTPMWLFVTATKAGPGVYAGTLYRTTGTPYDAPSYSGFAVTPLGDMKLTFADGASGIMDYTVAGVAPLAVSQTKAIVRQVLVAPGIVCR